MTRHPGVGVTVGAGVDVGVDVAVGPGVGVGDCFALRFAGLSAVANTTRTRTMVSEAPLEAPSREWRNFFMG